MKKLLLLPLKLVASLLVGFTVMGAFALGVWYVIIVPLQWLANYTGHAVVETLMVVIVLGCVVGAIVAVGMVGYEICSAIGNAYKQWRFKKKYGTW